MSRIDFLEYAIEREAQRAERRMRRAQMIVGCGVVDNGDGWQVVPRDQARREQRSLRREMRRINRH